MAFTTHKDAKEAGWFSRRHRTSAEHYAASAEFKERSGRAARLARVKERQGR